MQQFQRFKGWDGNLYTDDYFLYNIGPGANGAAGSIANGVSANTSFTVQADSNFEWIYTTWYAELAGATAPLSDSVLVPISLLITDGGSGRQLFSQNVPITSLAGIGREPYPMPKKRIFMSKSTVNFFWTNFGPTTFNNVSITLHGRKIFDVNP